MRHELVTPKWYGNGSKDDFIQPINHVRHKFKPSKVYVIAMSLGASVMTHVLSEMEFDGAVLVNVPMNFPNVI